MALKPRDETSLLGNRSWLKWSVQGHLLSQSSSSCIKILTLCTMVLWERILSSRVGIWVSDSLFRPDVCDWLFASKYPGWWAHIKCWLSFSGVRFALLIVIALGTEGKEGGRGALCTTDFLLQLLKERVGVIPKWKIFILFRNVLTPSHTALSFPRSNDSLFFGTFLSLKKWNTSLCDSKFALEWGMKNYSLEKQKPSIFKLF